LIDDGQFYVCVLPLLLDGLNLLSLNANFLLGILDDSRRLLKVSLDMHVVLIQLL
jgi:hypothetical protein